MVKAGLSRGAQLLSEWRSGRNQNEVCGLLGVDKVSYCRYEKGVRKPPAETMLRIEARTGGRVSMRSWFESPRVAKRKRAA